MLDAAGAEYTVRRYLEDPPTASELSDVLDWLGLEPWDVVRTAEKVAGELGLKTWAALRPTGTAGSRRWRRTRF